MGVGDSLHILDFLSLIGYNFVGLIVTMLVKLCVGELAKYLAFAVHFRYQCPSMW